MRYYTIQGENDAILIADNEQALTRFYNDVFELPDDYVEGKYIVGDVEIEIDVPEYKTVEEEVINPETGETEIIEVQVPVMIDKEIEVPDYDDEGNIIGYHTEIIQVQKTHKETVTVKGLVPNPNWEEEQAEKERIRIANLHMTRGDVFRGLLLAKGVTRADMRGLIEAMPETTPQEKIAKEYALIDFDEALEFYRGVTLIDTIGEQLGISPTQMDKFFETKDWKKLLSEENE